MKTQNKRLCIYPKDITLITGKSYRYSARLLQKIRTKLKKDKNEFISVEEFCQYTSLKLEQVERFIIGWLIKVSGISFGTAIDTFMNRLEIGGFFMFKTTELWG